MADRPEPRTHAGKALHKGEVFDLTVAEDRRRLAIAIEAEAEGAAPLDYGALIIAAANVVNGWDDKRPMPDLIEALRIVLREGAAPRVRKGWTWEEPRAEGLPDPIDGPVEWLAQAYMDLCNRVDEPFSATLIDEARRAVAAPRQTQARAEGLDPLDALSAIDEKLYQWEVECRVKGVWRETDPDARMTRWIRAVIEPFLSRPSDEAGVKGMVDESHIGPNGERVIDRFRLDSVSLHEAREEEAR